MPRGNRQYRPPTCHLTPITLALCSHIVIAVVFDRYLHKPYLISGNKFDLRIYVYVTSYDPLRIYIFTDGLVRFASCKSVFNLIAA